MSACVQAPVALSPVVTAAAAAAASPAAFEAIAAAEYVSATSVVPVVVSVAGAEAYWNLAEVGLNFVGAHFPHLAMIKS